MVTDSEPNPNRKQRRAKMKPYQQRIVDGHRDAAAKLDREIADLSKKIERGEK